MRSPRHPANFRAGKSQSIYKAPSFAKRCARASISQLSLNVLAQTSLKTQGRGSQQDGTQGKGSVWVLRRKGHGRLSWGAESRGDTEGKGSVQAGEASV